MHVVTLRALGLGDLLTALPALRALRRGHPDAHHVLLAPRTLSPLVEWLDLADEVADLDHRAQPPDARLAGLVAPRPAVAVNLHGRGPASHRALQRVDPGDLVAFANPEAAVEGPSWDPEEHEVRRWMRLLEERLHLPCHLDDLRIAVPGATPGRTAVLHPGAASPARRWPAERWAALARHLTARGLAVVLTGGPAERGLAEQIADRANLPAERVLAGRTDLRRLLGLVAGAVLFVAGDTGPAHVATAVGTRSVLLFGPTPPSRWGPVIDPDRHHVLWSGRQGDPHAGQVFEGLLDLEVATVLDAVDQVLPRPADLG